MEKREIRVFMIKFQNMLIFSVYKFGKEISLRGK